MTTAERDALVVANVPLARWWARRLFGRCPAVRRLGLDDARGEAALGLVVAARRYDPARGPFVPLAFAHCRGRVMNAARAAARWESPLAALPDEDRLPPGREGRRLAEALARLDVALALRVLGPAERELLGLVHGGGLGCAAAGARLGLTYHEARGRLARALGRLRTHFRVEGV